MNVRRPPEFGGWGELIGFLKDPSARLEAARRSRGDVFEIRIGLQRALVFATPTGARQILQTNQRNYRRPDRWMETLHGVTGPNVLNTEGETWLFRRRTMQPAFQRGRLDGLAATICNVVDAELSQWPADRTVDIRPRSLSLTMAVVGRTLFGDAFDRDRDELHEAFKVLLDETFRRLVVPVRLPEAIPTPHNRKVRRARQYVFGFLDQLIAHRDSDADQANLLGMLAAARDPETGRGLSDEELRNETLVMVHAGHETTASTLSSALWLLGKHPEWQERLRDEVRREIGDGPPTAEAIGRCDLLDRFLRETMRMYPAAWAAPERIAVDDDIVDDFQVRAGERVWIAIRELHRNATYWQDPLTFDPDRFLPERSEGRPKMAWIPFAGGRRRCIGEHLAMLELRIALARMLMRFEIATEGDEVEPPLDVTFTLAPARVVVTLRDRLAEDHPRAAE